MARQAPRAGLLSSKDPGWRLLAGRLRRPAVVGRRYAVRGHVANTSISCSFVGRRAPFVRIVLPSSS